MSAQNENIMKPKLSITSILIQDPEDGGYTAYFAEFPEIIAEGRDEDEATRNLIEAFSIMLEAKKQDMQQERHFNSKSKIKSFEFELA